MLSRNSYSILRRIYCNALAKSIKYSTNAQETVAEEKDPAPFFFNNEIQDLLMTLTHPKLEKVFRKRKDEKPIVDAEYKFMTDEELEIAMENAKKEAKRRLQMPPVVKKRTEIDVIVSKDPELQGVTSAKFVFTDITYPMNEYERLIVIREPNGILRYAKWEERKRINQIYYPMEGREMNVPQMFYGEYLQDLLKRQEYEFILDRACVQFDPNDPEYHRITEAVYSVINEKKHFATLRSTRHYGPLVFHLVWTQNIESLLIDNIRTEMLEDAVLLIKLYNKIYPDSKSATLEHDGDDIKYIQDFINVEVKNKGQLQMTLQALKEIIAARKQVEENVKKAHGL